MSVMKKKKSHLFIVPETHWDRAWYLPFEVFRRKLVQLFDRLFDLLERNEAFRCFVADGQTIVVEDYLEIRPEKRRKFEQYISEGRLAIGPWYILPDEYIVCGESLVRNLLIGDRMAKEYGKPMKVGYVPDPFGHVSQLPQILNGFGIDSFIFTRGYHHGPEFPLDFCWQAPDGSQVLAIHQHMGYANAAHLGYPGGCDDLECVEFRMDSALGRIESLINEMSERSATNVYLLNNGVDHIEPQENIIDVIKAAEEKWPKAKIKIARFDEFVDALKKKLKGKELNVINHELTTPHGGCLKGVYSARTYLKQANTRCEQLLLYAAEPLEAMASLAKPERTDERAILDYAWKLLLKNHPHDDICGCSVDRTHRDNENIFERVEELSLALISDAMRDIANSMDHSSQEGVPAVIYNPSPRPRNGAQRINLLLETDEKELINGKITACDKKGNQFPVQVLDIKPHVFMESKIKFDMYQAEVAIDAEKIPAMGFKTLYLQPQEVESPDVENPVKATSRQLENEYLKIRFAANGTFSLTDKTTGITFKNQNIFEDTEDCGDEYNWSDLENSKPIVFTKEKATIELVEKGPLLATIRTTITPKIPAGLTATRQARAHKMVPMPITSEITLRSGSPYVEIKTTVTNNAKSHRLRALFPTQYQEKTVQAGGHFDTVDRPIEAQDYPQYLESIDYPPTPNGNFHDFVRIGDRENGLSLMAKGLCEYEPFRTRYGTTLTLTLFRSVGDLSLADMRRRPGQAGPNMECPEAQMIGTYTYEYALYPHKGDWDKNDLAGTALDYTLPIFTDRGDRTGAPRFIGADEWKKPLKREGDLNDTFQMLNISTKALVITTHKRCIDNDLRIIRLYNQTNKQAKGTLKFHKPVKKVWLSTLNEEKGKPAGKGQAISLTVAPKQIVTLLYRF